MSRKRMAAFPPAIQLEPTSAEPLYRQIYMWLREAILSGQFEPGLRLPSTRWLAMELDVSRNTVVNAFDQLMAEGYVEGRPGGGTYVASTLPEELLHTRQREWLTPSAPHATRTLSKRSQLLLPVQRPAQPLVPLLEFNPNLPALDAFPSGLWAKLVARCARRSSHDLQVYGPASGYRPLREAIAAYLNVARGVCCEPEQVIVVNGSQQALDLAARLLLDPGDCVWIEDPGYFGAQAALRSNGAHLVPVPIDAEGFSLSAAQAREPCAKLAYITPSYQFPLGVTMSLARRLALLEWASQQGMWIVEDDYNSEYRYAGHPLSSLQGLDTNSRVIYLGSFSKVLFPALRLGYMVVPTDLVDVFTVARFQTAIHAPLLEQAVIAEFIEAGHFTRHLRRMRTLYAERQARFIDAAEQYLDSFIEVQPAVGGMHLIGWLPRGVDDRAVMTAAIAQSVACGSLSTCCIEPYARGGLLLGYAVADERRTRRGMQRLAQSLNTFKQNSGYLSRRAAG